MRVHAGTASITASRDAYHLRHNNCQRPVILVEQRLHTYRTNLDVAFRVLQTKCPKRQTIRAKGVCVKPRRANPVNGLSE